MLYHFFTWWSGAFEASSVMGRIGIYGVSIFYVLSGMTMCHVYRGRVGGLREMGAFFIKRGFRIFPLLWLVTIIALVLAGRFPPASEIALNLSGLFGFVHWDLYFSPGVWSIGNELVFYALFPFVLAAVSRGRSYAIVTMGIFIGAYVAMSFVVLRTDVEIADQWWAYTNPANQAALFVAGVLIVAYMHEGGSRVASSWIILIGSVLVFILWPVGAEPGALVTGANRIVLSMAIVAICGMVYRLGAFSAGPVHKPLALLGDISYSIYLIHPLIYSVIMLTPFAGAPRVILIPAAILATLSLSLVSYRYLERPLTSIGRRLAGVLARNSRGMP